MISKIIIGNTFGPCISYVLQGNKGDQVKQKETGIEKATILKYNYCFGNKKELIEQFNEVKNLNTKVGRAVAHVIISFTHQDKVSNEQMVEIALKFSIKMGFDKNQFLAVKHNDMEHNHLHLVYNRISFEGKTVSDSNNYQKMCAFCREMEIEFGFEKVLSPNRFLPKEQRVDRKDIRFETCKLIIQQTLNRCKSWDELRYNLLAKGIMMEKGRGIAFIDAKKVRVKGSKIGFSFDRIEDLLKKNQNVSAIELETNIKLKIKL